MQARALALVSTLSLAGLPSAFAQTEIRRIDRPIPNHGYGMTVAADDGLAVAGWAGVIYDRVPVVNLETGAYARELVATGLAPGGVSYFGAALAMDGPIVAVGAPGRFPTDPGAVHIFDIRTGQQTHRLVPPTGALADNNFGVSVSMDGGRVLVGDSYFTGNGTTTGRAYLFDAATGQLLRTFQPSSADVGFGRSVSLHRGLALVGSPGSIGTPGEVFLFDTATGGLIRSFSPPDPGNTQNFGYRVALSAPYVVASSITGIGPGQVDIFDAASGTLLHELTSPTSLGSTNRFGQALDVEGTRLAVGAPDNNSTGLAHIADLASGTFIYAPIPSDAQSNDFFGRSVGLTSTVAVVGCPGYRGNGALFVYSMDGQGTSVCVSTPNSTGEASRIDASGSNRLSDQSLILRASDAPSGQFGLFASGTGSVQTPLGNGTLCLGGQLVRLSAPTLESAGEFRVDLDFAGAGAGAGAALMPGTYLFQCWYRDPNGGGAGFDLSNAVEVMLVP